VCIYKFIIVVIRVTLLSLSFNLPVDGVFILFERHAVLKHWFYAWWKLFVILVFKFLAELIWSCLHHW